MKSASGFHIQQNKAYHGAIILQVLGVAEGTISYSYPAVDVDKTKPINADSSKIITERNKAYGSRTSPCEEQTIHRLPLIMGLVKDLKVRLVGPNQQTMGNGAKPTWNAKLMVLPFQKIMCTNHFANTVDQ